ncbi:unnamed protein product [Parnassius apollo]|uniref:beta-glucosidase n=1 Tax=Parnassius apollo TaxID=110799 RepID=A0A8S3YFM9_PARAO|nr:unnamed protein product [Parnassius apollo]
MSGWSNPHIVDWFGDYARTAFQLFGDRVKYWITMNEPYQVCNQGYGDIVKAPMLNIKGVAEYICAKNLLLAHARAYHIYDEGFRSTQEGAIFISFSAQWYKPASENDTEAANEHNDFQWQFIDALIEDISCTGGNKSAKAFLYRNESVYGYYESPSFGDDLEALTYQKSEWIIDESEYIRYIPWGFHKLLTKIRRDYNNPPIIITENGFGTHGGLNDDDRVTYYKG